MNKPKLVFNKTYLKIKKENIFKNIHSKNAVTLAEARRSLTKQLENIEKAYSSSQQKEILENLSWSLRDAQKQLDKLESNEESLERKILLELENIQPKIHTEVHNLVIDALIKNSIKNLKEKNYVKSLHNVSSVFTTVKRKNLASQKVQNKLHDIKNGLTTIYVAYQELLDTLYNDFKNTFEKNTDIEVIKEYFHLETRYNIRKNHYEALSELKDLLEKANLNKETSAKTESFVTKINKIQKILE